jgi:hypothetical protein
VLCGAVVHAFEPLPALHSKLMLAAPSNFTAHAMAVSDEDGFAEFRVNRFDAVSSLLPMDEAARSAWIGGDLLHEEREILVPTTRLDTFMEWDRFSRISEVGPTGCVVAVEPSPRELARLRANLAASHLDNVTVVAAAWPNVQATLRSRSRKWNMPSKIRWANSSMKGSLVPKPRYFLQSRSMNWPPKCSG